MGDYSYVWDRCSDDAVDILGHAAFDLNEADRRNMENATEAVRFVTDTEWLQRLTVGKRSGGSSGAGAGVRDDDGEEGGRRKKKEEEEGEEEEEEEEEEAGRRGREDVFVKLHFQQLMLIDTAVFLLARYNVGRSDTLIMLNYVKDRLGLDALSTHAIHRLFDRMSVRASNYVIPRRCGKSTFAWALLSMMLAFAPGAELRAMYTAHTSDLCREAMKPMADNIGDLLQDFNRRQVPQKSFVAKSYLRAEAKINQKDARIRILFKRVGGPDGIARVVAENTFKAKPYASKNAHRGATYNFLILDETNFLAPSVYEDVIPQLLKSSDLSKMICTTSHKNPGGGDQRLFVNLRDVRSSAVLSCVIEPVCPNHCMALVRDPEFAFTSCPCNIFYSAVHININKEARKLIESYSMAGCDDRGADGSSGGLGGRGGGGEEPVGSRSAILGELGIVPPGFTVDDLDVLGRNVSLNMATEAGRRRFASAAIDVCEELFSDSRELRFRPDVVSYLDPSPASYKMAANTRDSPDSSKHAIVSVTRAMDSENRAHYAVLGVEEFSTEDMEDAAHNSCQVMATFYMGHVYAIHKLYDGFFNRFFLIPEINSFDLDYMWELCRAFLGRFQKEFSGLTVYAPCIVGRKRNQHTSGCNDDDNGADEDDDADDDEELFEMWRRRKKRRRMMSAMTTKGSGGDDCFGGNDPKDLAMSIAELKSKLLTEVDMGIYKIGYRMTREKVKDFLRFFTTIFNPGRISLAKRTISLTVGRSRDLAEYLTQKLQHMRIETRGKTVRVTGKKRHANRYVTDDVPVCLVMATTLYPYFVPFVDSENCRLLRLDPPDA